MKTIIISLILSFFISFAASQPNTYININSKQFKELISQKKVSLIDVRTENEYKNEHISHAAQLNYYSFSFKRNLLLLPKDQAIYLYCNTGYRSEKAAEILAENGYEKVYNLKQGIMEWNLLDYPTVSEPDAKPDETDRISPEEFEKLIASEKPVLIDFYAPWCAPCRKMMPMIDSLKTEYHGSYQIEKINADASKRLIKKLKLGAVPYFAIYKNGQKMSEKYGYISRNEIAEWFEKFK